MGNSDRNPSNAVHPTVFLVAWFVLGFGLERLWPVALPGASLLEPLSVVLLVPALALFGWSALELHRHGTTMEHKNPTTDLVTSGPYRFSRHPIYTALVLVLAGLTIETGSAWFLILTIAFWAALHWLTIAREEAYLAQEFGEEYVSYRSSVRPWL